MPGKDKNEKETIASKGDLQAFEEVLRFCNAVATSSVSLPVESIRKSFGTSDSGLSTNQLAGSADLNSSINVTSVKDSFKASSSTRPANQISTSQQDSKSPSTSRFEKVLHLSNVGLCPAEMSPPVEDRLLKRKRTRTYGSSPYKEVENLPHQNSNEYITDAKSDSYYDCESPVTSPRSRKLSRSFGRNLNNEFSPEIRSTVSTEKYDTVRIDSPEPIPDETNEEQNQNDCSTDVVSDDGDSDRDSEIVVTENREEESDEIFRSPRIVPEKQEASLLQTPSSTGVQTRRSTRYSSARKLFNRESSDDEPEVPRTPKSRRPRRVIRTPKVNVKLLTPTRGRVDSPLRTPTTPRDRAKHALALSAAPESLPCRGKEFQTVYDFVREKISSKESGVLCINGVPGSGKTATIRRVLKKLMVESEKKKLNKFKSIEVNAFDLRRSKEIYRKIYEQLTNERKTVNIAEQLLTERFESTKRNKNRIPVVLIIDEFDCLLAKKRDVIYKMVEWQAFDDSQLVLLTIANKLDFSDEKKLFSRIKFEKLAFVAYSFRELEEIIKDRLKEFNGFQPEAIEFIARKVAATSGDARKALDICRQVLDTVEAEDEKFVFNIHYVGRLLDKIFSNPNVQIIKQLTDLEKIALRALRDELTRTDRSFCTLWTGVWNQFEAICNMDGFTQIDCNSLLQMYAYLASIGLVKIENDHLDQHSKIWLKCDTDVIKVALKS